MHVSEAGLALIAEFEGFRAKAYKCPAGIWTIGFGHTSAAGSPKVVPGMVISKAEGLTILKRDVVKFEQAVLRCIKKPMNQNEFDALVSFCYNVGEGNFSASSVCRHFNNGKKDLAAASLSLWVKGGGKVLPGLVARRKKEMALFNKKVEAPTDIVAPVLGKKEVVAIVEPTPVVAPTPVPVDTPKVGFWAWVKAQLIS